MENIVTRISIDLQSPAVYEVVKAQQNDTNSRIIEVILTNNGKQYPLNEVSTIKFGGHRSDGSSFEQDCIYTDDLITIVLKEDVLGLHGLHEGRITLYDSTNNQILSTPTIKISVQKDPCFDKENITEIPRNKIDETILEIGAYEEKLNQHIADVDIHPTKEEMESAIKKEVEQNINDLQEKIDNLEEEIGEVDATPENVVLYANDGEVVDVPTIDDNGMTVNITVDSELSETSENPVQNKVITAKLDEVFQFVSDGKELIASAITDMGVNTDAEATFEVMAENIRAIQTGGGNSSTKTNVLSFDSGDSTGIMLTSSLPLAESIDISQISISNEEVTLEGVTRLSDYSIKLLGDFYSYYYEITINTASGFFVDNFETINTIDVYRRSMEFSTAGEIIAILGGESYSKVNNGFAIGGYGYNPSNGWRFAILVADNKEDCNYCHNVGVNDAFESFVYDKDGKTYYYPTGRASKGDIYKSGGSALKINDIEPWQEAFNNGRDWVSAMLDFYFGYI